MSCRQKFSMEPGAAMFHGLRVRLTLWYSAILASVLLLFGITLYFGVQQMLFRPVDDNLLRIALFQGDQWKHMPYPPCEPPSGSVQGPPLFRNTVGRKVVIACFDQNGALLTQGGLTGPPASFLSNTLVLTALHTDHASTDRVDGGHDIGPIERYAYVVRAERGGGILGVVQVGEAIGAEEMTLQALLIVLLSVGILALLGAAAGGFFLADRALVPARLAFAYQQRFIGDASHELRTPLTLLRADAEVLLRGRERLSSEDAALLEDILVETSHMTTLATNMLTLARLDAKQNHYEHEVVNLSEVAARVVRRSQSFADQTDISLQLELKHAVLVIGDPVSLEQALLILLDNAIKYNCPGGSVLISATIEGEQACIKVRDTGIGMAAEHLPHMGERFYRVDKARSRETGGTGLGLSIARGIISAHKGTLTFDSTPGQGTTAIITLPYVCATTKAN